jgi:hypothetical protein
MESSASDFQEDLLLVQEIQKQPLRGQNADCEEDDLEGPQVADESAHEEVDDLVEVDQQRRQVDGDGVQPDQSLGSSLGQPTVGRWPAINPGAP